ncbi:hypothetical protein RIF29_38614 [Crotalaria pallida]|uniref:Uncharacterized protein n=1 Tax=Crotalaria pallida TaxID=3830 RepID=A0AAN9E5V8_CROPI
MKPWKKNKLRFKLSLYSLCIVKTSLDIATSGLILLTMLVCCIVVQIRLSLYIDLLPLLLLLADLRPIASAHNISYTDEMFCHGYFLFCLGALLAIYIIVIILI